MMISRQNCFKPVWSSDGSMKPFHLCATPHQDIIDGKMKLEDYAANLTNVYRKKNSSEEYLDPKTFFKRTRQSRIYFCK